MTTDEALRHRLTEIMSAAGLDSDRVALEVLYLLPGEFVKEYTRLFHEALKLDDSSGLGGDQGEVGKAAVRGVYKGKRPMLSGGAGKRYRQFWVVRSDQLLDMKHKVDKRLRAIAREIAADMADRGVEKKTRCRRCGRIMARDWNFCPGCGQDKPIGE